MFAFDNNYKRIGIIIITVVSLFTIAMTIYYFNRPGVLLTLNPKNAEVIIDGIDYKNTSPINIEAGNHLITSFANNYQRDERIITVKPFGKTKVEISLKQLKEIIQSIPLNNSANGYMINGGYNDFQEPVYTITYNDENSKTQALNWLKSKGVNQENSIINFVQDGD